MRFLDGRAAFHHGGMISFKFVPDPAPDLIVVAAVNDTARVALGETIAVYPLANDVVIPEGPMSITSATILSGGGTVSHDATEVRITADAGAAAGTPIIVEYGVADDRGAGTRARITVEVGAALAAPELVADGADWVVTVNDGAAPVFVELDDAEVFALSRAEIESLDAAPLNVVPPTLAWAPGPDGTSDTGRLVIDPGTWVHRDSLGSRRLDWTLAAADGTVVARGTGPRRAIHALGAEPPAGPYTLTVRADDAGAGGPVAATITTAAPAPQPSPAPARQVTPAAFDGSTYYERTAADWSGGIAPKARVMLMQTARENQDTSIMPVLTPGNDVTPSGFRYNYRLINLSYRRPTGGRETVTITTGMTTPLPTTVLARIIDNGDGTSQVDWSFHNGETWTDAGETVGEINFLTDQAWAIGRNPTEIEDEHLIGTVYRVGMWDYDTAAAVVDITSPALRDALVDGTNIVADPTLFQAVAGGTRIFDKYDDWATGSNDGVAGDFDTYLAAKVN